MTSHVESAVAEIRATFEEHEVEVTEDGQGGATVIVANVAIGDQFEPDRSGIGFVVSFQYPAADVYPHFLTANPRRVDRGVTGRAM